MDKQNCKIGFIGTGVMGKSMVRNLMKAGFPVSVYSRTKEKADELLKEGAIWSTSPKELAQTMDVIISIVGYPSDVEEIYLGEDGIIHNGRQGLTVIDMTTSKPSLAVKIYEEAKLRGIDSLDAPVSGGDVGAKEARLAIMVGGDQEIFIQMKPVFEALGTNIVHQGAAGAGQHTKMCNQIVIASGMIGVCEALVYAKKAGLDQETVLQSISTGAAGSWSLSNLAPRIIQDNFDPGFFIKHFIKDMSIAIEEAEKMEMNVPGLSLAKQLYEQLAELGEENSGTQALYKYWNE
ncbi:NAD(P)-dependent oxidoreductase [Peribacillus alkalitolerans]|uniref:NAD(P)-dependent oxidoreductase n=1 Tax=Peribacillus alkalitolerans TaxID=1550385 RepID=UPI0013D4D8F4|nr:NAD(P)-dependent oxidoreductase [Peribacillus alkalitolerans]